MVRTTVVGVGLALCTLLVPRAALAQQAAASGIAGVVKDASGAVLPGVTVEAASPALIEKVRTVVTDGEGRFNIVDLRPGTYTVTFSLTGFSAFRRDGIELTSGFTATRERGHEGRRADRNGHGQRRGAAGRHAQRAQADDRVERPPQLLPSSVKNLNNLVALTPGFRGNEGFDVTGAYTGQIGGTYHGKGGTNVQFDGMGIQHASGNQGYNANAETVQELAMTTSGISADSNADGAIVNMIPKEGGNTFTGGATGLYSNKSLMSDNLSDELIARGLKSVNALNYIYDAGFTLGGPIKKDRLWFFGSFREWGNERQAANKFYNATQHTPFYTPDLSRPAYAKEWYESKAMRVTWRASDKNKFNVFADPQRDCHCPALTASGSLNAPEAFFSYHLKPAGLYQVDLERAGHQQAAARGRHRPRRRQLADLPAAGSDARRHFHHRAVDRHAVQLRDADVRTAVLHAAAGAALQRALLGVVRDRQPRVQGRLPARAGVRRARGRERHPQSRIHVQQPDARSASRSGRRRTDSDRKPRTTDSTRRISGICGG